MSEESKLPAFDRHIISGCFGTNPGGQSIRTLELASERVSVTRTNIVLSTDNSSILCSNVKLLGAFEYINIIVQPESGISGTITLRKKRTCKVEIAFDKEPADKRCKGIAKLCATIVDIAAITLDSPFSILVYRTSSGGVKAYRVSVTQGGRCQELSFSL